MLSYCRTADTAENIWNWIQQSKIGMDRSRVGAYGLELERLIERVRLAETLDV